MAKSRPFAYNPGSQIPGTQKFGNLTVGSHDLTPDQSGVQWWNGPDEDLGYVIAETNVDEFGNPLQPTQIPNVYGSVGFFRTDGKNTTAFINLTNAVSGQNFTTATQCKTWLESNNRWTSWGDFATEAIVAFKTRVLSSSGNFEAETNLETQLNTIGSDLFNSASLIITPNAYKEQTLYSATPSPVGNNLLVRSSEFENSTWSKTLLTISSTLSTAPNNLLEARTVQTAVDTAANRHRLLQGLTAFISTNSTYTFSIYAKKNQHRWIQLNFVVGFDLNSWANFDLENGVIGNKGTGAIATIENVGNGWYRLSIVGNPIEGQLSYNAEVITTGNINSGRYPSYQSTVAENVFDIWGAQVEIGTVAGPYIPTVNKQAINETICDLTTTRATTATRVNEQGLVELVPYNLFPYSEDFINSNWAKQNTTIRNNSIAAPNGMMTADKIVGNSGVTYSYTGYLGVNVASIGFVINSTERVVSFYLKYGGLNRIRVIYGASANLNVGIYVEVDLQLGIITGTYGGSFASNFFIEYAGNGWYRVGFTVIMTIQSTNNRFGIGLGDTTKTVGDGVDGVYVWGAQLVDGSSNKTYQLTTNRLNVPRIDYTTGSPTILIEPQRTNLIVRSEEFENASWQKNNISIIPNATISPSGLMNADKLVENNLLANHDIQVFTGGTELRTNSIFVKAGERSRFILWAGASGYMFDLINLTTTPGNNASSITNASIQDYGNGWYRCSITSNAGPNNGYRISLLDNETDPRTPTPQYQGDGVSGLYIWGAQRENASSLTSYIPTTTGTVTRNADVISNTNASTLIGQTEGTIFINYNKILANDGARNIISINDGSTTNLIEIWDGVSVGTLGRIIYIYFANSLGKATGNGQSTVSPSGRYKICLTYTITPSLVNFKFFINGVKLDDINFTYTAFSSPLSIINIGNRNGTGVGHGGHDLDFILKTRITDEQAIQLTTL